MIDGVEVESIRPRRSSRSNRSFGLGLSSIGLIDGLAVALIGGGYALGYRTGHDDGVEAATPEGRLAALPDGARVLVGSRDELAKAVESLPSVAAAAPPRDSTLREAPRGLTAAPGMARKPAEAPANAPRAAPADVNGENAATAAPERGATPIAATQVAALPVAATQVAAEAGTPSPTVTPRPRVEIELSRSPPAGKFGVQVGAFASEADARRFVRKHAAAVYGLPVFVVEASIKGKTWYRVRVGAEASRRKASSLRKRLPGALAANSMVTAYR